MFAYHLRALRTLIVTAALLACGDSSSNPVGPGGGSGGVAEIAITPNAPTITLGSQLALQASVRDGNGNLITGASVFWASADGNIVTVSTAGVVTAVAVGSTQVAASSGGQSARAVITVITSPVTSLDVAPSAATLVVGGTTVLQAVPSGADGQPLTGRTVVWASSASQVAAVDATGTVIGVSAGSTTITATCEGKTASATITVTVIPVAAIAVVPGSATLSVGQSTSLSAVATDAHGNVLGGRPMTWTSADSAIASVSNLGLVTAVAPGSTTISATAEGKTGLAQVVVTALPVASIAVTPTSASLLPGGTTALSAVTTDAAGNVLTGRMVTWASSAPSIATVSASGVVTAITAGSATITATSEGKSAAASVTVTLASVATVTVDPASASLVVGSATTIAATAKDANGNILTGRAITWTSNTPGVATVDANGVVTAIAAGSATITATSEGKSAIASITVSLVPVASIATNPTSANLFVGASTTIAAITKDANGNVLVGRVVGWTSSTPSIATVNPTTGLVTAVAPGNVTITATSETKHADATITVRLVPVATVSVDPSTVSVIKGLTTTLAAITKDANGNVLSGRAVTWHSLASSIATVNTAGLVTAVLEGTVRITATSEGQSDTATVTVLPVPVASVSVSPIGASLEIGANITLTATARDAGAHPLVGRTITWTSDAPAIATVDPSSGLVTAIAVGTANITATCEAINSAAVPVTVVVVPVATVELSPTSANLQIGATTTFAATTKDANGNSLPGRAVAWASNAPAIATVDPSTGLVTAIAAGTANITASSEGKTSSAAPVTVTAAPVATVELSPTSANLQVGATTTLAATTKDGNGNVLTGRSVTWASDAPAIATVDPSTGLVTAVSAGTANITASSEGMTSTAAVVTVTQVPVATVLVNPATASLSAAISETTTLVATAQDGNGNTLSGRTPTWASDNTAVATVDPISGLVTAISIGTANITATIEGIVGTASVTVNP